MSDDKQTPQSDQQPIIDLNQYVKKEDFERLTKDKEATEKKAGEEVSKLRDQLLTPEYLEFLESKRKPKQSVPQSLGFGDLTPDDIDKLPNSKVLQLAEKVLGPKIVESIKAEHNREMSGMRQTLNDVILHLEVREAMANNADYKELEKDTERVLLNSKADLTVQQAVDLARTERLKAAPSKPEEPKKAPQSEKPSTNLQPGGAPKTFKNEAEARQATMSEWKERHGVTSDAI